MEWVKGIRELRDAKSVLEHVHDEITQGTIDQEAVPKRIATARRMLEYAKDYFSEE